MNTMPWMFFVMFAVIMAVLVVLLFTNNAGVDFKGGLAGVFGG